MVQKTFTTKRIYTYWSTPPIDDSIDVLPNHWYRLRIEAIRKEQIRYIKVDGRSIGTCNPDGNNCAFYDCSQNETDINLSGNIIRSNKQGKVRIQVSFIYTGTRKSPYCKWKNENVDGHVRVSLYPMEGIIFIC